MRLLSFALTIFAFQASAQPVQFDPSDFGKIVISPRQSASELTLEQAFGDYQNEPVVQYGENGPAVRMGRPIGRLDLMYETGKPGFCTAFIVDAEHILTNHHCIPGMDGDATGTSSGAAAAQFVAGYIKPGHDVGADKYTVSTQIVETSRELDYTVLKVFGNPSAKYGIMKLTDDTPLDSEFLWIIGHPQGQSQHISREGCAASIPAISGEGKLVHTCDTMGGNSGSPVIRIVDSRVIGLHHAGDNRTGFNLAIPMRRILENSDVLVASLSPNSSNAEAELAALRKQLEEMQNKEAPAPTAGPSEDEAEIERLRKELEDMRIKAEMEALRKKLEEMQAESDARNAAIVAAPISPSRTPPILNEPLSCHDLWYQRNLIYDRAGYCFKTAKAQRYFSNSGCNGGIPSGSRLAEAKRIKALEVRRGC